MPEGTDVKPAVAKPTEGEAGEGTPGADVKPSTDNQINLKVRDAEGGTLQFRIKRSTPMAKLMTAYASRNGSTKDSFKFLFDGTRMNDDDTPDSLDMEDGDNIDAMVAQQGGMM